MAAMRHSEGGTDLTAQRALLFCAANQADSTMWLELNTPVGIFRIMPHPVFTNLENRNCQTLKVLPVLIHRELSA
jgi:hypothetical protein